MRPSRRQRRKDAKSRGTRETNGSPRFKDWRSQGWSLKFARLKADDILVWAQANQIWVWTRSNIPTLSILMSVVQTEISHSATKQPAAGWPNKAPVRTRAAGNQDHNLAKQQPRTNQPHCVDVGRRDAIRSRFVHHVPRSHRQGSSTQHHRNEHVR